MNRNFQIFKKKKHLKRFVSQLFKLVLKDSPYIQKLSGTNLFPIFYIIDTYQSPVTS